MANHLHYELSLNLEEYKMPVFIDSFPDYSPLSSIIVRSHFSDIYEVILELFALKYVYFFYFNYLVAEADLGFLQDFTFSPHSD